MSDHTPGPWRVMPNHDAGGGVEVRAADRGPVARVDGGTVWAGLDGSGYRTRELAKANARLIAAAPDLLEALEELVNEVDASREGAPNSVGVALLNASVVIAKTRGES